MKATHDITSASTQADTLLRVDGLRIAYTQQHAPHIAVDDVSFEVNRGEAFGLVGESGSGKSSVAMAILRYLPRHAQSTGTVLFEGRDLSNLSRKQLRALRGNRISAVYQHAGSALNPALTIGQQIVETIRAHRKVSHAQAHESAAGLLAQVRMPNPRYVLERYPHELSGGMQQRATIAMGIALDPALLILDEPTTALDASVQAEIVEILHALRRERGTGLLLISHDIELIRRTTERVGVMRDGVLVEQGATDAVIEQPTHTYTRNLIASIPSGNFTRRDGRLAAAGDLAGASKRSETPRAAAPARVALRCAGIRQSYGGQTVLHDVDLQIATGETYGLIGESGSGKSTLAKIVTGLAQPTAGTIALFGAKVAPRVEARTADERRALQMVFQSPDTTLNPRHKIRRILRHPLRRLARVPRSAIRARIDALLSSVKLPLDYRSRPPTTISGGQRQRVAIARAFAGSPGLVVLDEPTSALDVSVQATVLNLLNDLQREHGTSYLLISHDLKVVRYMADRVGVLYRGHLVETGHAKQVFDGPNHPYTRLLLTSAVQESACAPADGLPGCAFAERCPLADDRCRQAPPPLRDHGEGHTIRCWLEWGELKAVELEATPGV